MGLVLLPFATAYASDAAPEWPGTKVLPPALPSESVPTPVPADKPVFPHSTELAAASAIQSSCEALIAGAGGHKVVDALGPGKKKKLLAACKDGDVGTPGQPGPMIATNPGACIPTSPVCATDTAMHVPWGYVFVTTLDKVTILARNLLAVRFPDDTGSSPDTRLYLVRCTSTDGSCREGDVVAIDDDGGTGFASKIEWTPSQTGTYRWVLIDYAAGNEGFADLEITANGQATTTLTHLFFAGYHSAREVHANDWLFVGKNTNGQGFAPDREYHDSTLFFFSNDARDCDSGACGVFRFNDDTVYGVSNESLYLSRIKVPVSANARVVVATYGTVWSEYTHNGIQYTQPRTMNARLLHMRPSTTWSGDGHVDSDGDGLPRELEEAIGACDRPNDTPTGGMGVGGKSCAAFGKIVNDAVNAAGKGPCSSPPTGIDTNTACWNLSDSDNDGLRDDWEVWGALAHCPHAPRPPTYDAGACVADTITAESCPTEFCVTHALSARSDPDPAVYDTFYNNYFITCVGDEARCRVEHDATNCVGGRCNHGMTATQRDALQWQWTTEPSTCWNGTQPPCDDASEGDAAHDLPYRVALHAYDIALPQLQWQTDDVDNRGLPMDGGGFTTSYFNRWFGWARPGERYAGIFRMAVASHAPGGVTAGYRARQLIWGNTWGVEHDGAASATFTHEAGHSLGLAEGMNQPVESAGCPASACDPTCQCPVAFEPPYQPYCLNNVHVQTPINASVMNYFYNPSGSEALGLRQKSSPTPTDTDAPWSGCEARYLRFARLSHPTGQPQDRVGLDGRVRTA